MSIRTTAQITRTLGLCTAVLMFLTACITVLQILAYLKKPKDVEFVLTRTLPGIPISVTPDGPDMRLVVGTPLNVMTKTHTSPDGAASIVTEIWGYPPGGYLLDQAPNARSILGTLDQALREVHALSPRVSRVDVVGGADGIPVRAGSRYVGDLGPIADYPYYSWDAKEVRSMTLIPGQTAMSNEAIAFLRAYDFGNHVRTIPVLSRADVQVATATSSEVGDTYRCSGICIRLKGVLADEYTAMSPLSRWFLPQFVK
jgi:hypothetical protein